MQHAPLMENWSQDLQSLVRVLGAVQVGGCTGLLVMGWILGGPQCPHWLNWA